MHVFLYYCRYKFIAFPLLSNVESGPNNCKRILSLANVTGFEVGKTRVSYTHTHLIMAIIQADLR